MHFIGNGKKNTIRPLKGIVFVFFVGKNGGKMMDDKIVMYILVNMDLKMGKGKIAAQVAHSAVKVYKEFVLNSDNWRTEWLVWFKKWNDGIYAKVVLKSTYEQMKAIIDVPMQCHTFDAGLTQIKKGSLTTMAFYPMPKSKAPWLIKDLKLL
jgi:PTH2 family peptidyl-tRNA hydrolase